MQRKGFGIRVPAAIGLFTGHALVAIGLFAVLWRVDSLGLAGTSLGPLDALAVNTTFGGMAEVTVGLLGMAITVVSIIVELAATRYTSRITEVFLTDRTNQLVLSSYVMVSVVVIWTELTLQGTASSDVPRITVVVGTAMLSAAILSLLPYFAYLLAFLSPLEVVARVAERGTATLDRLAAGGSVPAAYEGLIRSVDQLGDTALKSVQNQDKGITVESCRALTDLLIHHMVLKPELPSAWFDVYDDLRRDSDLVSFHRDVLRDHLEQRTWVEFKGLLQLRWVYQAAVDEVPDVAHYAAIQVRRFGVRAAEEGEPESADLALRVLNTFMRVALNQRSVHAAYDLLNEYRQLAVGWLHAGNGDQAVVVARRMAQYGQLGFGLNMPFVLETVAYDLSALLETACLDHEPCHDALLEVFLDVDREPEDSQVQEQALRGVRKAQIKLASFYLDQGLESFARRIHDDMASEPLERLAGLREELETVTQRRWHELSDRGWNFDFLEEERRSHLSTFFAWFEDGPSIG